MILPTYPAKIPQTSPNPHKERNSFINCWWNFQGIFQGYVGEILDTWNPHHQTPKKQVSLRNLSMTLRASGKEPDFFQGDLICLMAGQPTPPGHVPPLFSKALLKETNG